MSATAKPPFRILVLQLARLGDTLQSLMALRAAKQLYPQLSIHFVAREKFSPAVKRVPWLDEVITLPTESLLGPVLAGHRTEAQAVADLAAWTAPLAKQPWDLVLNWSYSEASSYLTALLPARVKLGYTRHRDQSLAGADGWSHFLQGVVLGGIDQNIHLTDILTTQLLTALQIHLGDPVDAGDSAVTSKGFFTLELQENDLGWRWRDSSRRWVGIQLGASHPTKTWDPARWSKVASYILKRHPDCGIVLLGGQEDAERARQFQASLDPSIAESRPVVSLVGKTDFDLWASVVGQCQWLLAGDTAALHLASVLGTRVLNVSIGPVRWAETGPYGNGHYVVTPENPCPECRDGEENADKHACRAAVTPEAVYGVWAYASSEWSHRRQANLESHFSSLGWSAEPGRHRFYRSRIRTTEDGGGVCYDPATERPLRMEEWSSRVVGHLARAWYCGWTPAIGQEMNRGQIHPALVQSLRQLDESAEVMAKICTEAAKAAAALQRRTSGLRSEKIMGLADRQALTELGNQIADLDRLIERMGKTHPALRAFSQMARVLMHNLRGEGLSELGQQSVTAYRQLNVGVAILRDWVRHTLDLARPVALRKSSIAPTAIREPGLDGKDLIP